MMWAPMLYVLWFKIAECWLTSNPPAAPIEKTQTGKIAGK